MLLDAATIAFSGGLVSLLSGVFLLGYWWHDRAAWAAFWWALGNGGMGVGIILLAFHSVLPFFESDILAPLLLDLCAALAFIAARIFNRGSVNTAPAVVGITAWIAAVAATGALTREQNATSIGAGTSAALYAAAAFEFWRGRGEELRGRMPIIGILMVYAIALLLVALQFGLMTRYVPVPSIGWLGVVQFVGLGYAVGVTLFLIVMLKGRSELSYKLAALTDPLTGLANRRAFMDRAQRVFDRSRHDADPVALLAFDLDRFKLINDTFGHATGDKVLCAFADVLSTVLRPINIVARIGGEEFVVVVPGGGDEVGIAIASRVRDAFQKAALFLDGHRIEATVSAGVATTARYGYDVTDLLASADGALYQAKNSGRNRVVLAGAAVVSLPPGNVVRLA